MNEIPRPQVAGLEVLVRRGQALAARVHASRGWARARRYLPVYRWAGDLDDKTIAGVVAGGWALWLAGGLVTALLAVPGAAVVGLVLAVVGVVVDVVVVRWWMGYRRSAARLRHQILARSQIAAGRELADCSLAAGRVVELGAHVRPALAAGAQQRVVPGRRVLTATDPHRATRDLQSGELPTCTVPQAAGASC